MYAFVGGLSISSSLLAGPLVTWILSKTNTKTGMFIGIFFELGGLVAASFAKRIWHLFLTQGLLFGVGMGFLFQSSVGVASQWYSPDIYSLVSGGEGGWGTLADIIIHRFDKKRSVANGIMAAGSGLGGIAYSLGVRAMISDLGLAWTFRTMALTTFIVNFICTLLMKDRNKQIRPRLNAFDLGILRRYEFLLLVAWGVFSMFGYVVLLFSLPDYAASQGFSKSQGSILSAVLSLGMTFGRPTVGWMSDRFGRINVGFIMTLLTGLSCFIIWMPAAESGLYGVAVLFSLLNGAVCGTFWTTIAPITVEVVSGVLFRIYPGGLLTVL